MVRCIRVPKSEGNDVRERLKDLNSLDIDHRITSDNSCLFIPITIDRFEDYEVMDVDSPIIEHRESDYRMFLSEEIRDSLPNSYDNIGDVTVIKIPDELLKYKNQIGEALLKASTNTRCVLMDNGVKGELRIRDLEIIAGNGPTETRHRESGVTIVTDPAKVYYNQRLATERERVASLVKDGEVIIDMFAGVAPFPLTICKVADPKIVYAIDLNHDAVEYAKINVKLNHFSNIVPIEGDAREVIKELPDADRIIMNLPQIAQDFLPDALSKTKKNGTVHMHKILERDSVNDFSKELIEKIKDEGLDCEISCVKELKTYSPSASVFVFDIKRK